MGNTGAWFKPRLASKADGVATKIDGTENSIAETNLTGITDGFTHTQLGFLINIDAFVFQILYTCIADLKFSLRCGKTICKPEAPGQAAWTVWPSQETVPWLNLVDTKIESYRHQRCQVDRGCPMDSWTLHIHKFPWNEPALPQIGRSALACHFWLCPPAVAQVPRSLEPAQPSPASCQKTVLLPMVEDSNI